MTNMELEKLVRPNILALEPYSCARNEFSGVASVWLDANESPFNAPYNRYPDPLQLEVKERLSHLKGVPAESIFLGNGSDECIDLMYRIFCRPGIDNVVAMSPSYGMYEVCASVNDVEYRKVSLNDDFSINFDAMLAAADECTKVMWICSPNNPTGTAASIDDLLDFSKRVNCILVIDEAYIDFSSKGSMLAVLPQMPNVVVMQTLSKAWGSAGVRMGMAFACPAIVSLMNNVKYPYNVNILTQRYALEQLGKSDEIKAHVVTLLEQRELLKQQLAALPCVKKIHPTDANFVLVETVDADGIYNYLLDQGVVVRNRNRVEMCLGCLRITVGLPEENLTLINCLKNYGK